MVAHVRDQFKNLIRYWTNFNAYSTISDHVQQNRMLVQRIAMTDAGGVQQYGIDDIQIGTVTIPICAAKFFLIILFYINFFEYIITCFTRMEKEIGLSRFG